MGNNNFKKKYEIGQLLGEGLDGKVYSCKLKDQPDQEFAVKIINVKFCTDDEK
jgi:hypothetical protein